MTAYADLDCSVIGELPPGRQPVQTVVLPEQRRVELVERVAAHCAAGQQAYWVCPLIEESELVDSRAASALERRARRGAAERAHRPDSRPHESRGEGRRHARVQGRRARPARRDDGHRGRRRRAERDADGRRERRANGFGAAAPAARPRRPRARRPRRACCCIGRRCRSSRGSACSVLRATNDGFAVAQKDLELRGPGEVLGTRQTGVMQLRVADLLRDADLLPQRHRDLRAAARDGSRSSVDAADSPLDPRRGRVCEGLTAALPRRCAAAPRIAAMRRDSGSLSVERSSDTSRLRPACRGGATPKRCCGTTRATGA